MRRPLLLALLLTACGGASADSPAEPASTTTQPEAVPASAVGETPVRNVILLIGDGMGPQQMGLLELWAARASTSPGTETAMARMADAGVVGLSMTDPADGLVVDSACSATQLASGAPALGEVIGLDGEGNRVETVLEMAESRGLATGLVSDTRLTHATPAAFAAHVPHRSMENEIAAQMLASGVDVLLSGGARHWVADGSAHAAPFSLSSRRDDGRDLVEEAATQGYAVAFDRHALADAVAAGGPVLGLFAASGMMDGIDWHLTRDDAARTEPTLREMTEAALTVLEHDEDGFFLMVEGGQIDWAGHDNDAGRMLHEMRKFDDALDAVLDWAEDRDDTLVVLTADHETGGFGFSYSAADLPAASAVPGDGFGDRPYQPNFNFGRPDQLDALYAQTLSHASMLAAISDTPSAEALAEVVNAHSSFPVTLAQAERILRTEPNPYHVDGHAYLDADEVAVFDDFAAFYPFGAGSVVCQIGRQVATAQNVVWATGTHTHTPVAVVSWGPAAVAARFGGVTDHVEVGRALIEAFGWE